MKAGEFIHKIKKLGRKRGVTVNWNPRHGKGSHGRLWYGDRFTTVKSLHHELSRGLLHEMLAQLGLTKADLA